MDLWIYCTATDTCAGIAMFGFEAVALVEHLQQDKQHTSRSRGSLLSVSSLVIVVSTNRLGQEKFISN